MTSGYLSMPVRTLRQACRDIATAHPERMRPRCSRCDLRRVCLRLERSTRSKARRLQTAMIYVKSPPPAWA